MFGQKLNPSWFFDSLMHQEAVSRLLYLVESRLNPGLITGPDGSGKTRVLLRVREELARTTTGTLHLSLSGLDSETALWQIASGLCSGLKAETNRREIMIRLRDEILGRSQCRHQTVVLLDDMHRAVDDMSSILRLLMSFSEQSKGSLTIIAASGRSFSAELTEQCLVRVHLTPMDSAESCDFVRTLIRQTLKTSSVVEESAVRAIADFGMGNTARITRICELLRVVHEISPDSRISEETVEAMVLELSPDASRPRSAAPTLMRAS
ncbi:MAG: AAA family ATPase [Planctomycetota bacterium]